jgi:quercetin dioxygenase-like cupin family protein
VFWHVYQYPSRAAAQAAAVPRSTVVEAFGRVMLYVIVEEGWRPAAGERLAVVGPLSHEGGQEYTARYIEGVFTPGMQTRAHRHSGAEGWYVLEGAQCLETPNGVIVVRAGETAMVAGGAPMVLTGSGPASAAPSP